MLLALASSLATLLTIRRRNRKSDVDSDKVEREISESELRMRGSLTNEIRSVRTDFADYRRRVAEERTNLIDQLHQKELEISELRREVERCDRRAASLEEKIVGLVTRGTISRHDDPHPLTPPAGND
jgi:predicted  nucleic acid-binding Zn-ribbon protein